MEHFSNKCLGSKCVSGTLLNPEHVIRGKADMISVLLGIGGVVLVIVPGRCSEDQAGGVGGCATEGPEPKKGGGPLVECNMGLVLGAGIEGCRRQRKQLGT